MKKFLLIFLIPLVIIALAIVLVKCNKSKNSDKSAGQNQAEIKLGEGIIKINDPTANFQKDVDFNNKQAVIKYGNNNEKEVVYTIFDLLQPFNIDSEGDQEWPFLMRADYSDKKIVYLIIARQDDDKFTAVDQVIVGDPTKIDDIHQVSSTEIAIDAFIGEGSDKESVILAYTFQANKIVPGKDNIDLNTKPKPKETPAPKPSPTATNKPDSESGEKGKVALSFDDGPGKYTPDILDILKDEGIKATFFEIGENAEGKGDYTKRVHAEGHELGNHTYDHQQLNKLSYDKQLDEMKHTNDILKGLVPEAKINWMRPPYGSYNDDTKTAAGKLGMEVMLWNVDTRDWSGKKAADITSSVFDGLKDGAIILMHDGVANSSETAKALPDIIKGIRDRGYKMVTISELKGK